MENPNITYSVKIEGKKPVLITRHIMLRTGEVVSPTHNIEYNEAKAIVDAFNRAEYSQEFNRRLGR